MTDIIKSNEEKLYAAQASKQYNKLVRMVEQYIPHLLGVLTEQKSEYATRLHSVLTGVVDAIDSCPLYAFSLSAHTRAIEIAAENKKSSAAATPPPIPARGCIISKSHSSVFLFPCETDQKLIDCLNLNQSKLNEKVDYSSFVTVRAGEVPKGGTGEEITTLQVNLNVVMKRETDVQYSVNIPISFGVYLFETSSFPGILHKISVNKNGNYVLDKYTFRDDAFEHHERDSDISPKGIVEIIATQASTLLDSLLDLTFTDLPVHYVVEERPAHIDAVRKKRAKAARFDDRERWIILDPEQVKKSMKNRTDLGGTHSSPSLHLRRAHDRVLKHECFTTMKGTILRIRPTWIGDRSWGVKRTKYKVISRLGASKTQA